MFNVHGLLYIYTIQYIDGKVNVQCSWIIIYIERWKSKWIIIYKNRWKSKCSMFMDYYIYK